MLVQLKTIFSRLVDNEMGIINFREILMLHGLSPTFSPFNGELHYSPGETIKRVSIKTLDDSIAEPNTLYIVGIIDVKDDQLLQDQAVISTENGTFNLIGILIY